MNVARSLFVFFTMAMVSAACGDKPAPKPSPSADKTAATPEKTESVAAETKAAPVKKSALAEPATKVTSTAGSDSQATATAVLTRYLEAYRKRNADVVWTLTSASGKAILAQELGRMQALSAEQLPKELGLTHAELAAITSPKVLLVRFFAQPTDSDDPMLKVPATEIKVNVSDAKSAEGSFRVGDTTCHVLMNHDGTSWGVGEQMSCSTGPAKAAVALPAVEEAKAKAVLVRYLKAYRERNVEVIWEVTSAQGKRSLSQELELMKKLPADKLPKDLGLSAEELATIKSPKELLAKFSKDPINPEDPLVKFDATDLGVRGLDESTAIGTFTVGELQCELPLVLEGATWGVGEGMACASTASRSADPAVKQLGADAKAPGVQEAPAPAAVPAPEAAAALQRYLKAYRAKDAKALWAVTSEQGRAQMEAELKAMKALSAKELPKELGITHAELATIKSAEELLHKVLSGPEDPEDPMVKNTPTGVHALTKGENTATGLFKLGVMACQVELVRENGHWKLGQGMMCAGGEKETP